MSPPNFAAWETQTLADFAREAYEKLQTQQDEIEQLKLDLKTAISAYRDLLRR